MKREIKFRAWNELEKKMSFWTLNDLLVNFGYSELDERPSALNDEFMQFTGLKDKNGVEIYEGDIVGWYDNTFECVWSKTTAGFIWGGIKASNLANPTNRWAITAYDHSEVEVIGNIYKNPDLIK